MQDFTELYNGLNAFRELFKQRILPETEVSISAKFLRGIAQKDYKTWTIDEAIRLHNIIKPYGLKLKRVGFDISKIPVIQIQLSVVNRDNVVQPEQRRLIGTDGNFFIITFPYRKELYDAIKQIPRARFMYDTKRWMIPLEFAKEVTHFANGYEFQIGERAMNLINLQYESGENMELSYMTEYIELNIPLKKKLYPYQTVGGDYVRRNKRVVIADQMRLGKTMQSIAGILVTNSFPCIVIVPKSLRLNWQDEWHDWTDRKAIVLNHKNVKKLPELIRQGMADVVITNYDGVQSFLIDDLKEVNITTGPNAGTKYHNAKGNDLCNLFNSAIIDEAHHCRNKQTIRYKCVREVFKGKEVRICLTGSPIVKGPKDLAALFELIGRIEEFGGYDKFIKKYKKIDAKTLDDKGKQLQELQELNTKMRSLCFIRRERHQVNEQISEKFRKVIRVDLDNQREYDHAWLSLQSYMAERAFTTSQISKALQAEMLVKMGLLKQISARGKSASVKEFVSELIDNGEKVIIGCWYNDTVQYFKDAFREYGAVTICGRIDGHDMKPEEIHENKKKFQTDDNTKVIIITYGKGGEGHTLSKASSLVMVELGWTYKDQAQMEDRGIAVNKTEDFNVYVFLGKDTLDEDTYEIIDKRRVIEKEAVGGSEHIENSEESVISAMKDKILKKISK